MIPKIVHYCWFGGKRKPKLERKCIKSWKKYLPDYQFKEWNESNFDLRCNQYVQEAYNARRYAFVSDYVRLYALYTEGGVYMDTDVELFAPLDDFLHHRSFFCFEDNSLVSTGLMASEKRGAFIKEFLDEYVNLHFITDDGSIDLKPNTERITSLMQAKGLLLNNTFQDFPDLFSIYPNDYFSPKSWKNGEIYETERTRAIHHFAGSWLPENNLSYWERFIEFCRATFHSLLESLNLYDHYIMWRRNKKAK